MPIPYNPGRKPENEPLPAKISPEEAVESIPEDLIKELESYKSIKSHDSKLNQDQQLELMEFIARYAPLEEVNEHFFSKYKLTISQPLVYQYKRTKKWQPIIKKLREKYLLGVEEVAMSHKRVRLDRRERIYTKAMKDGDIKTALSSVNSSQEEMSEKTRGHSITFNQYNVMSDDEIEERKKELLDKLNQKQIIEVVEVKSEEKKTDA